MKHIFILLITLLTLSTATVSANTLQERAEEAYAKERYPEALQLYTRLLGGGESANIFYNIGNCYYRMDSIHRAVLYYEKALLLSPADEEIRFNLEMARAKTTDRITPQGEMFFVTWSRGLCNLMSEHAWAVTAILCFLLFLVSIALVILLPDSLYYRIGFYTAIVTFVLCVVANLFAYQQKSHLDNRDTAIIMVPTVKVRSTPSDTGTELFVIHSGTKVFIEDETATWYGIHLSDGKNGWIEKSDVEKI
jgi:tetratricopeptide (TPR) repeat protein